MELNKVFHPVIGRGYEGTHQLQWLLGDYADEPTQSEVQTRVMSIYDQYQREHPKTNLGMPVFKLMVRDTELSLEIFVPVAGAKAIGRVPMTANGETLALAVPNPQDSVCVRSYSLTALREELLGLKARLHTDARQQLKNHLQFLEDHPATGSMFELDATPEGFTIVAYRGVQRVSVLTLFYPEH